MSARVMFAPLVLVASFCTGPVLAGSETPALTRGEASALRISVKKYYVCADCSGAEPAAVWIDMALHRDGTIDGQPKLYDARDGSPALHDTLFQAGRRALLRAASAGVFRRLPTEKYDRWKRIVFKFTTEGPGTSQ